MNNYRKNMILSCLIIALLACVYGCESTGGTGGDNNGSDAKYTLNGVFVQDVNNSTNFNNFAAIMTRDSDELQTAQLFFDSSVLMYNSSESKYTFQTSSRPYWNAEAITMNITDSTIFADTISTRILDSIWFTSAPDSSIPNQNGTPEQIVWAASAGVDGYIVAVVLASSAYSSSGYSAYVTETGPSTTIPPDAFRSNNVVVPGWYNIYVYGYVGSPDVVLSAGFLPVPLPSQLSNNIAHAELSGHFGSIIVSRMTMIEVVSQ